MYFQLNEDVLKQAIHSLGGTQEQTVHFNEDYNLKYTQYKDQRCLMFHDDRGESDKKKQGNFNTILQEQGITQFYNFDNDEGATGNNKRLSYDDTRKLLKWADVKSNLTGTLGVTPSPSKSSQEQLVSDEHKYLSDKVVRILAESKSLKNFLIADGIQDGIQDVVKDGIRVHPSLTTLYHRFQSSQAIENNIALFVNEHIIAVNLKRNQDNQEIVVTVANSSEDNRLQYGIISNNAHKERATSEINKKISTISQLAYKLEKSSDVYQLIKANFKTDTPVSITQTDYTKIIKALERKPGICVSDGVVDIVATEYIKTHLKSLGYRRLNTIKEALKIPQHCIKHFPSLAQQNGYDCGIFTIHNLLDISGGKTTPSYNHSKIQDDRSNLDCTREKKWAESSKAEEKNISSINRKNPQSSTREQGERQQEYVPQQTTQSGQYIHTTLYKLNDNPTSAIRVTNSSQDQKWAGGEIEGKIAQNLSIAIEQTKKKFSDTKLFGDNDFVKCVINFAQQNGGVGSTSQQVWNAFVANNTYEVQDFAVAKEFSYQYQKASKASNIYTGRQDADDGKALKSEIIGARLKRIPKEKTDNLVVKAFGILHPHRSKC
jgi:hypothetical protein